MTAIDTDASAAAPAAPTFAEAARVWAKIGLLSFGGPAGQIALMHKELVEERRWIGEQRFLHALNYCMLLPGPEAQQLATYIGWLLHRTKGGLVAGLLFILPGALVMLGLSILYALYRHVTTWVTFAPCFLWILVGGPYVEALRGNTAISSALSAITAAVVGVIMNLAVWFALHVVFRDVRTIEVFGVGPDLPVLSSIDWRAAALSLAAAIAMLRFKTGMIPTLAACALAGLVLKHLTV